MPTRGRQQTAPTDHQIACRNLQVSRLVRLDRWEVGWLRTGQALGPGQAGVLRVAVDHCEPSESERGAKWRRSVVREDARMSAQERRIDQAAREAERDTARIGREIRQARVEHDLSQAAAANAAGLATSSWSRLERGAAPNVSLVDLACAAAAVGLMLHVRLYPAGEPIRDKAHLALLERLRARLPASAGWRTEVPFPNPGDPRAWDALIRLPGVLVGLEAETRGRDSQALQRKLSLKRRDGGVDHVILLLADTRHNRVFLRQAGEGLRLDFPVPGRIAMERLMASEDPGGNAIILI